jgi:FkbM family methyltransferase
MKQALGWWWPSHESHMLEWMSTPKNKLPLNGRDTYQGRKQVATLAHCHTNGTAVDVGAHIGLWSFNLAHRFEKVVAFEPVLEHRECFIRNLADFKNVDLHAYALGAVEGTCRIETTKGSSGDSQVRAGGDVPMRRLDSFNLENVDLLKIDCEGYEENVLIGGLKTIERCKPTIIVEQKRDMASRFGLKPQGAVSFLQRLGYKVVEEISGDYILVPA